MSAFDTLPDDEAQALLLRVCAAPRWAREVVAGRPYGTVEALQAAASAALDPTDLDAALAAHPRIGDPTAEGPAAREQAGVASAPPETLTALAEGNRAYEERFGRVYLVCAEGRSAEDLLVTLRARLANPADTERAVALGELAAINRLRLGRVLR
ncbi:2-oxo-4-hydroxy-4-carboxy-5-ureidoimidazoline decarboxylase [Pseudonocardia oroxyli]|uniref:2-oxo-4-hydroxy-4-carboxy-5-ureidoimidazoline decarboxylase n=1 Tax=Pseudonocardia oroxyli TaxID=366584 RepID=A0A1G7WHX9_PSEOR|nr:2-oxo-4-hydroxy-4-carboxy-5-ureidoimidazoline decarboxylase [Pseudonocardia oroxyli]SDG71546.1 2-oxo-4-hydroxy-4-carboxy-5-ureidoimidazoline decarboxylase [Pseudonocardia oroxyli]